MTLDNEKWLWMMGYCGKNEVPPANDAVWKKAEQEYLKMITRKNI